MVVRVLLCSCWVVLVAIIKKHSPYFGLRHFFLLIPSNNFARFIVIVGLIVCNGKSCTSSTF